METVPVHKLADIFVASFEISFEEQLCMLDSIDLKVRLSKATELVDRHLQVHPTMVCVIKSYNILSMCLSPFSWNGIVFLVNSCS